MKVTILYKFYDNIITSDTFMFSSDFAFIEIPIDASCKHGISFRPILYGEYTIADHYYADSVVLFDVSLDFFYPFLFHEGTVFRV